jgi:prefoldin subunit 5
MATGSKNSRRNTAARQREKEQAECIHEDIQKLDARNGVCKTCGATFDNMDEWDNGSEED